MYTAPLVGKREIAKGTMEFSFARPEGFTYEAGQTIDLALMDPSETDSEGNMRTFTLLSAPHEPVLRVAARMRDTAFKRVLRDMPLGAEVSIDGPYGSFLLHENTARPAVFLAGGIGVTPFHSMVSDAAHKKLPHALFLFYANRHPEDAALTDVFRTYQEQHPSFTFVPTISRPEEAGTWEGEVGRIDAAMLDRYVPENTMPIFYIAGPQDMVTGMRVLLTQKGVSNDDIRFEEFSGY